MDDKRFTYFFIGFMVVVFLSGIIYLFMSFSSGGKEHKIDAFEAFSVSKDVYSNKKKAYDDLKKDSFLNVRSENVRVNLSSVFGGKVNENDAQNQKELIPGDGEIEKTKIRNPPSRKEFSPSNKGITLSQRHTTTNEKEQKRITYESLPEAKTLSGPNKPRSREGFFSSFSEKESPIQNTVINAVVHSRQEIYEGATVKLRITSSCIISGNAISANTFVYGIASVNNERVGITINSITVSENILSVHLSAYDKDGIPGIYIPGLAIHEARKEGVDEAINEAATRLNVPVVGKVPLHVARSRNSVTTAILTDGYRVILK